MRQKANRGNQKKSWVIKQPFFMTILLNKEVELAKNQSGHGDIHTVRSVESTDRILLSAEKFKFTAIFLRMFITGWVFTTNTLLGILKFILFKKWGYSKKSFKYIVVYTVGVLGDNVAVMPAMAALRRRYPQAKVKLITNCQEWSPQPVLELLKPLQYIDHFVIVKGYDCPVQRHGWQFKVDAPEVKGIACDLFVNLSPFGNRGWIGAVVREMIFAKKLKAKYAVGFRMSTYTRRCIFNSVRHRFVKNEPRRSRKVLKELGLRPIENEDLFPHNIKARELLLKKMRKSVNDVHSLFVINPGAKFKVQCWPADRFGIIASWLAKRYNATVILTGTANERDIANEVIKASDGVAINLAGETTIQELVELLRMAKACVTNDTGTMHLAAMSGTPTVAIFTTRHSPAHWLPIGDNIVSIFTLLDCSYCYNDFCENPNCLNNIGADHVIQAIKYIMEVA